MNNAYEKAGVNYGDLDPFKRAALEFALPTGQNLPKGYVEVTESRGESAYVIDIGDRYIAHVEEGLGTKNLVADTMLLETNVLGYRRVAQCAVAMIVNDLITCGARPLSVLMHCASGDSAWFRDVARFRNLLEGWKIGCDHAMASWGGGETPALKGLVNPESIVLSGSGVGVIDPKERYIKGDIEPGDQILLFASSGIHANSLTLARKVAEGLPDGYKTVLPDGRMYGEVLLDPTYIYAELMEKCFEAGVRIHYAVNITGHGWRKLMRHPGGFAYIIEELPPALPIFKFLQQQLQIDDLEMYGTFNMGAGFALIVPPGDFSPVARIVMHGNLKHPFAMIPAGFVAKDTRRRVYIKPLNIEFLSDSLNIR